MHKVLKNFKQNELIFNEVETREILYFFFGLNYRSIIKQMKITDDARNFAQGLLIEAIDASYQLGFIDIIWTSTANPTIGFKKLLTKIIKGSAKNWFKHASTNDALNAKIYDSVRVQLAAAFKQQLLMLANNARLQYPLSVCINIHTKPHKETLWA